MHGTTVEKSLLTPSLAEQSQNDEAILNTYKLLINDDTHITLLVHFVNMC